MLRRLSDEELAKSYGGMMEQVYFRLRNVEICSNNIVPHRTMEEHYSNLFLFDAMHVQIRKVCEAWSIALFMLHRNGYEHITNKDMISFRADKILRVLRLSDKYYPQVFADNVILVDDIPMILNLRPGFTTEYIKDIYLECDKQLHAGRIELYLEGRKLLNEHKFVHNVHTTLLPLAARHFVPLRHENRALFLMVDPVAHACSCRISPVRYVL